MGSASPALRSHLQHLFLPSLPVARLLTHTDPGFANLVADMECSPQTGPTYYAASAYADHALNQSAVFKLVFAAGSQLHGASVPFIQSTGTNWDGANNKTLARIMSDYYISFVLAHDPNVFRTPGAPFWKPYMDIPAAGVNGTADFSILSVTYNSVSNQPDPDASPQCDFFYSRDTMVSN